MADNSYKIERYKEVVEIADSLSEKLVELQEACEIAISWLQPGKNVLNKNEVIHILNTALEKAKS